MMQSTRQFIARLKRDDCGLAAIEYAVLGAIVVAAVIALKPTLTDGLDTAMTGLFSKINAASTPST